MSKAASTASASPKQIQVALEKLGEDLRIARLRRGESLRSWAERVGVSVPTLQRMEAGDPSVGVSVYTMSLWLVGRIQDFANLADPASDEQALAIELAKLPKGRS
ncbi:MAG: XRE family transcriptional regulator [Gammaproteobacteria bacterium]|nr:XRE family transcriptional regulator [Gammaproteobacteria bacterium]MBU1653823.1 XRE family transcriptional regulator [Gammaproteobacteria bacterium]MBU1962151.1 XRE family transcriptional regulator [Gammaproteobacteria bacterium]